MLPFLGAIACAGPSAKAGDPTSEPATATPQARAEPPSPLSIPQIQRLKDPDEGLSVGSFKSLTTGVEIGIFSSEVPHPHSDGRIRIVRVDPKKVDIVAHTAVGTGEPFQGADSWAASKGLVVAFNPAMYHADGKSVFQLKTPGGVGQAAWKSNASSVLVVDDKGASLLDITCDGKSRVAGARTVVQSWRLLDCARKPTWKEKPKIWSHALLGADSAGRLLFIHSRTPWSTRTFTQILLDLPSDVQRLHYAEGGPEASLVVVHDGLERVWVGSYETGFTEHDNNRLAWSLPQILGVVPR